MSDPYILATINDDGSAKFTISDDNIHRFSVAAERDTAWIEYEETLTSSRGKIRVSEPAESIYRQLMQSDKMTAYLETNDCQQLRRRR